MLFSCFTARAFTLSHFKLDILQEPPHKKVQNTVESETMLCSTLLKITAVCSVFNLKRQFNA